MDRQIALVLLGEATQQARFVLAGARLLEHADAAPEGQDAEIAWFAIQGILVAAANVHKLLWSGQRNSAYEREAAERLPLREALGITEDSCLREKHVRNSIEHFDERIIQWGKGPRHYRSFVIYDADTGIVNFGRHTASIPGLVTECDHIISHALIAEWRL